MTARPNLGQAKPPDELVASIRKKLPFMAPEVIPEIVEEYIRAAFARGESSMQHEANLAKVEAIGHAHSEGHLSAMVDELVAAVKEVEWSSSARIDYDDTAQACPWCGGLRPDDFHVRDGRIDGNPVGHQEECRLRQLGTIPIDDSAATPSEGNET